MLFENQESFHAWATRSKAGKKHALAAERASEQDRQWFERNPHQKEYTRAPIKNEFPPLPPGARISAVHVVQIRPGFRARTPLGFLVAIGGAK